MEIFNLNNLLYLIANMFSIYTRLRFVGVFFDRTTANSKLELLLFSVYYIANTGLHLLFANPYLNLFVNFFFLFSLTFLYKGKLTTRLISATLIYATAMFIELITDFTLAKINLLNELKNMSIVVTGLTCFMFVLILEKLLKHPTASLTNTVHWLAVFLIPIGSVTMAVIIFSNSNSLIGKIINITILLAINIMVFYLYDVVNKYYTERLEKDLLKQQNIAYKNQFEIIEASQKQTRMLKHDMKNHIISIQNMAQKSENDELLRYLNSTFEKIDLPAEYAASGNLGIDSILNYKMLQAEKILSNIQLTVNIPNEIQFDAFDINTILSNLIDNALEAIKQSDEKHLEISIVLECSILYITVKNSYCGKVNLKSGKLTTTKRDILAHGIGLKSVKHTVDKYNGSMTIQHTASEFVVDILLFSI